MNRPGLNQMLFALYSLLCVFLFSDTSLAAPLQEKMRVVVLNVGEGQAILLKRGNYGILIDTGHAGMAAHVLARIKSHDIDELDFIILTHLHPDHASGYFRLREAFPGAVILDNHHPLPMDIKPDMVRWVHMALEQDRLRRKITAGDRIKWRGVTIQALWPGNFVDNDLNKHSTVLLIKYGYERILIMADAGLEVEQQLIEQGVLSGPTSLLVVGHHGASDASAQDFLNVVKPSVCAISVNENNIRGYPAPQTLLRLEAACNKVLRTDVDGEICIESTLQRTSSLPSGRKNEKESHLPTE
jgi:competence protein ComEC